MTKKTSKATTILDTCRDPQLFRSWFKNVETWRAWFAFLSVMFGLPIDDDARELYRQCTGRSEINPEGHREATLVCGRRAGKSLILALIATYLAVFKDWSAHLVPGERGTIMIVAADKKQARTIFRYIRGFFDRPILSGLIERETAEALDLTNGVTIEILTASFRTVRGYTLIACLADEVAFWRNDDTGANPDKEIIAAIRPAMATVPGSMLLIASSPYARKGVLWDSYKRRYGKDGDPVLVWKAATRVMNSTVPQSIIDEAAEADPANAAAEYGAEFRTDVESFVSREVIEQCTVTHRLELPPVEDTTYVAFVDPSGGSSNSMTLAIAHLDDEDVAVLDAVREVRPPFSPDQVVSDFCDLLGSYGVTRVTGDRYGGEWPRERFASHGVTYTPSQKSKSEIYGAALPLMNSRRAELLDMPRLQAQLVGLERRTARGGRDSIDHAPGQHDDLANASLGAITLTVAPRRRGLLLATDWGVLTAEEYGKMTRGW